MLSTPAVASADVLRTMAHELRQPLSTIESIAYYLTLVLPKDDEKVHEQLDRIQQLVEQSNWIVTSAQQLADPLQASPQPILLEDLIDEILQERSVLDDAPALEIEPELPAVNADPSLARALIENLLTLFRVISTADHPAKLILRAGVLELRTDAPGFKSEASLGPGASLSLESARRIAAANGGTLELRVDPADGVRVRVMLT
ncbi:MAG TPA: hypothetical protein VMB85_14155 [Bryobacteraceae bacterium]|nr:hypothetical protein [Bryobacteraceae bacterium]